MGLTAVQRSVTKFPKPGTCKQKGNTAPRFPWPHAIRCLIHCIAHYLGSNDEEMSRHIKGSRPSAAAQWSVFTRTVPWFEDYYNCYRRKKAEDSGYGGPMEPLGPGDIDGRLLYLFTEPGRTGVPSVSTALG